MFWYELSFEPDCVLAEFEISYRYVLS